ncbi:MAG: hypothetical protein K8I04_08365 [Gammaproteobacteria bacterium]|nr:hypothetical protein [Gammaproteobacteria bacterium]
MVRKTALVTAMLAAFANQAYAMGLGDIRLNSVLNQPFNAEIELLSPTAGDLAQLRVVLASPEAYGRAGVERAFFHTKLRFAVVPRPDGSAVIKVTSRDAVREPYLDFLVEATWGSGQVLREYTVLVDPPALMPGPVPVTRAPAVAAPPPVSAAAPAPRGATPAAGYSGGEYRTSHHDTLWRIAAEVRPSDAVSMEQTMLGLLAANPEAFYDQNINNLKAGYVLRVPGVDELAAIEQADALADVRRQNRLWRDGRTAAVAAPDTPVAGDDPAVTDGVAAPTIDAAEPQLKLVAPEGVPGSGAEDAAGVAGLREELALASEAVAAERLQNQELNARVQQLEEQLATLNRLVELKNNELAQLGGTVTPMPEVPGTSPDMPADTATDSIPAADTGVEMAVAGIGSEAPAEGAPGMDDAVPEQAPVESAMELADDTLAEESTTPAVTPLPAIEPAATDAEPPAPAASQDEGLVASLLANPMAKWGAAGGAILVALFAWLANRRRRMQDGRFQESILAERQSVTATPSAAPAAVAAAAVAPAPAEPEAAEAATSSHSDSSLFTDFAVSDMGAIQNDDEADPIAEADVYLAYGRYQQAEELVRSAMARAPERIDVRLKLFEILAAAQNSGPFDTEAEALLADLGDQDDETWKRVAEMGRELSPSNPLYQSGSVSAARSPVAAVAVAEAAEPEPVDEELAADNGLAFDMGDMGDMAGMGEQVGDADLESSEASMSGDDDNSLDFDLGDFEAFARPAATAESEAAVADDLEFDLSTVAEDDEAANEGTLTASDEVATKLDLARAYMEMGDPDGARGILQEVMEEGSDTQRSEAESLLQKVS